MLHDIYIPSCVVVMKKNQVVLSMFNNKEEAMFKEFKEFAMKGNVVDLAVGIIIGGAFGKIVSSFVGDILMPPIGLLIGKVDFTNLFISLSDKSFASLQEAKAAGAPTLNYGFFFNSILDFLIVAFAIFYDQADKQDEARRIACPGGRGDQGMLILYFHHST